MNCNEFNNQLASLVHPSEMTEEMLNHARYCQDCAKARERNFLLFEYIREEKAVRISPFVKTRVMARIEEPPSKEWYARPALVTVLSVMVFIFGIIGAGFFENTPDLNPMESIAADYYFQDHPGTQLEEIWLNTANYEE